MRHIPYIPCIFLLIFSDYVSYFMMLLLCGLYYFYYCHNVANYRLKQHMDQQIPHSIAGGVLFLQLYSLENEMSSY